MTSVQHWKIDKTIPIANIISFLGVVIIQSIVASWYLSKMDSRVAALEEKNISYKEERIADNTRYDELNRQIRSLELSIATFKVEVKTALSRTGAFDENK